MYKFTRWEAKRSIPVKANSSKPLRIPLDNGAEAIYFLSHSYLLESYYIWGHILLWDTPLSFPGSSIIYRAFYGHGLELSRQARLRPDRVTGRSREPARRVRDRGHGLLLR